MKDTVKLVIEISKKDLDRLTIYGEPIPTGILWHDRIFKAVANGIPYKPYGWIPVRRKKNENSIF